MPHSTVPTSSTQATWRVSVKKRAVLCVRSMACCSFAWCDMVVSVSLIPGPLLFRLSVLVSASGV